MNLEYLQMLGKKCFPRDKISAHAGNELFSEIIIYELKHKIYRPWLKYFELF